MKQPLTIIRGTTQTITIAVKNDDGTAYTLADGETLRFGVKRHPEDADSLCLVKKSLTAASLDNGLYILTLLPSDTKDLPFGNYFYDVGLQSGNNYYNVIECSDFIVAYNITLPEVSS